MTNSQNVALRIVRVWHDTDDRGRPVTKYEIENEVGESAGVFRTPHHSRLSETLFAAARRNRVR